MRGRRTRFGGFAGCVGFLRGLDPGMRRVWRLEGYSGVHMGGGIEIQVHVNWERAREIMHAKAADSAWECGVDVEGQLRVRRGAS